MISLHIHLEMCNKKILLLSIIFIDAHNFTNSEFPSLALNVLLKDYLIAQLQPFWNSTQKVCVKNKTKTNSKKTKKATQRSLKRRSNGRDDRFGI